MKKFYLLFMAIIATLTSISVSAQSNVVISQVYGAGGNAGATYTHDYVELFNPTSNTISLTGYTLQYASATGTFSTTSNKFDLSGSIAPGRYFLVRLAASSATPAGSPLPVTPDLSSTSINMAAGAGKIALVSTGSLINATSGCPISSYPGIVDFVGYGTTANCSEGGSNAPAPSTSNAIFRVGNGCTDNNNNGSDFTAAAASPRNSASPANTSCGGGADVTPPTVSSLSPAHGSNTAAQNFTATITFNENIQKLTGSILVKRTSDNSVVQTIDVATGVTVSGSTASFSVSGLSPATSYYIEVPAGAFEDAAGNDFAGFSGSSTWTFTTSNVINVVKSANFNSCTTGSPGTLADGFTRYSVTGTIVWDCTTFGRNGSNGMQINGFSGGTNVPNVDWLISPALDLTGTTYPLLSFWSRTAFNGAQLQLKVSTDYSGSGDPNLATWTDLNGRFPNQASDVWTESGNINLSAFKQPNVYIAFVYESTDDEGARWTMDDFRVDNSSTPPPSSITTSTTDIQFGYVAQGSSADKTFTFTGNDITSDVTITSTGSFLLSKDGVNFSQSITYTQAEANNSPKNVTVRFTPSMNDRNFNSNITIATSGLTSVISAKGTSIDPVKTLEVVNWNIEWFGSPVNGPTNDAQQEANVRTIMQNTGADIFGLTEIVDTARLGNLVRSLPGGYDYVVSDYGSHTNTSINPASNYATAQKLAFVYKTSIFSNVTTTALLSQGINSAADVSNPAYDYWASGRFPFMMSADVNLNGSVENIKFVLVHAKANTSPTATSYDRRKKGADSLHYLLSTTYANDNLVILGDFNDDLDQTITAGINPPTTSYTAFINDGSNFNPLTLSLSQAGKKSTVSYNDVIDHVIVSNEMDDFYMGSTVNILSDVTSTVSNYANTTSDHFPVFSRFAFDPAILLPVKLQSFTAVKAGHSVRLTWSTSEEVNAREFVVERSNDGRTYRSIGRVSASGNRGGASYQLVDNLPGRGDNFYRLRSVDIDDKSELSRVIKINFSQAYTFTVAPNPAKGRFFVSVTNAASTLQLEVVDMNGRTVKTQLISLQNQAVDVSLLQKGLYLIRLKDKSGVFTEKLVIE